MTNEEILEAIGNLTVLELSELGLEVVGEDLDGRKFGVYAVLLILRPCYVRIVARYARDAVEDASPVGGAHLGDVGDVPLLHDVVTVGTDPGLGEEGIELRQG